MSGQPEDLHEAIAAYNDAWNAHDVERIAEMHAPDMVFENHTAGERAEGVEALEHIARIFESWPDITFETRRWLRFGAECSFPGLRQALPKSNRGCVSMPASFKAQNGHARFRFALGSMVRFTLE